MIAAEVAGTHAHLSATVKGYADKRRREMHRDDTPAQRGGPNVSGWKQLAAFFSKGGGTVQVGGESFLDV